MTSTAIILANAHYVGSADLECCLEDQAALTSLVEATGRFGKIVSLPDLDGDGMRAAIRDALPDGQSHDEIVFYFSGHGAQIGGEFFYCGTTFDSFRPNETGLSDSALNDLLRAANSELVVKIIDACASGTLLIKDSQGLNLSSKDGFRQIVQLASCLNDQSSYPGEPLSRFTEAFCEACLRKVDGPVYYADIIATLRDDFLGDEEQTPFFTSQSTARETLVDDAEKLASFRELYAKRWARPANGDGNVPVISDQTEALVLNSRPLTAAEMLSAYEAKLKGPEQAKEFINILFDGVIARFKSGDFSEFFDLDVMEHKDFQEPTAHDFIVKILVRESRPDKFVTAESRREKVRDPFGLHSSLFMLNPEWTTHYDLELNCPLDRAQLRMTLTPKFRALQRLVLVLTCAPSLERCFIFEIGTQHPRTGWNSFDVDGPQFSRRWWRRDWDEGVPDIIEKVCAALEGAAQNQIVEATARITKE